MEPSWLVEARKYIGLREIKGLKHEPLIVRMWQAIKQGGVKDDETPWCAAFVGAMLENVGIVSTRSGWAKSYLNWGIGLEEPIVGCVVVYSRDGGGGHVGFVVGKDVNGNLLVCGGNQGDMVSIKAFPMTRKPLGYFWPQSVPMGPYWGALPVYGGTHEASTKEA